MSTDKETHEAALGGPDWLTPLQLSKRWQLSMTTIRAIAASELPYKEFGNGTKHKRRRYRIDWVEAYESHAVSSVAA